METGQQDFVEFVRDCLELRRSYVKSALLGLKPMLNRIRGDQREFERVLEADLLYQDKIREQVDRFMAGKTIAERERFIAYVGGLKEHRFRLRYRADWLAYYTGVLAAIFAIMGYIDANPLLPYPAALAIVAIPLLVEKQNIAERVASYEELASHVDGYVKTSNQRLEPTSETQRVPSADQPWR